MRALVPFAALAVLLAQPAFALNTSEPPDFSGDRLDPTAIGTLSLGSNLIVGTTGAPDGVVDRDYLRFTIAPGQFLNAVVVLPGTQVGGFASFIGIQRGSQVTVPADTDSGAALLGWHLFSSGDVNTDILDDMGFGRPEEKIGFSGPLPAGTYSLWIQELGAPSASYRLDFLVSTVPEPGTWALLAGGLALLARRARRR